VSSAPAPQFEPIQPAESAQAIDASEAAENSESVGETTEAPPAASRVRNQPIEYVVVIHLTRTWVQYGIFGFAVLYIVIGAVEALFGR
jgi:hypothetical protein